MELKKWVENWLPHRRNHDGALVTWVNRSRDKDKMETQLELYLRDVAKKGQLDFLPLMERRGCVGPKNPLGWPL